MQNVKFGLLAWLKENPNHAGLEILPSLEKIRKTRAWF